MLFNVIMTLTYMTIFVLKGHIPGSILQCAMILQSLSFLITTLTNPSPIFYHPKKANIIKVTIFQQKNFILHLNDVHIYARNA